MKSENNELVEQKKLVQSPAHNEFLGKLALRMGTDTNAVVDIIRNTCLKKGKKDDRDVANHEVAAFLMICAHYNLDPLLKEVHGFRDKYGGMAVCVGVDGWLKIAQQHPQFDGIQLEEIDDETGNLVAVKAIVHRKDHSHPTELVESLDECKRDSDPWKKKPRRMLRHKAAIQGIRYAFGIGGILDPDEADELKSVEATVIDDRPQGEKKFGMRKKKSKSAKPAKPQAPPEPPKPQNGEKRPPEPEPSSPNLDFGGLDESPFYEEGEKRPPKPEPSRPKLDFGGLDDDLEDIKAGKYKE